MQATTITLTTDALNQQLIALCVAYSQGVEMSKRLEKCFPTETIKSQVAVRALGPRLSEHFNWMLSQQGRLQDKIDWQATAQQFFASTTQLKALSEENLQAINALSDDDLRRYRRFLLLAMCDAGVTDLERVELAMRLSESYQLMSESADAAGTVEKLQRCSPAAKLKYLLIAYLFISPDLHLESGLATRKLFQSIEAEILLILELLPALLGCDFIRIGDAGVARHLPINAVLQTAWQTILTQSSVVAVAAIRHFSPTPVSQKLWPSVCSVLSQDGSIVPSRLTEFTGENHLIFLDYFNRLFQVFRERMCSADSVFLNQLNRSLADAFRAVVMFSGYCVVKKVAQPSQVFQAIQTQLQAMIFETNDNVNLQSTDRAYFRCIMHFQRGLSNLQEWCHTEYAQKRLTDAAFEVFNSLIDSLQNEGVIAKKMQQLTIYFEQQLSLIIEGKKTELESNNFHYLHLVYPLGIASTATPVHLFKFYQHLLNEYFSSGVLADLTLWTQATLPLPPMWLKTCSATKREMVIENYQKVWRRLSQSTTVISSDMTEQWLVWVEHPSLSHLLRVIYKHWLPKWCDSPYLLTLTTYLSRLAAQLFQKPEEQVGWYRHLLIVQALNCHRYGLPADAADAEQVSCSTVYRQLLSRDSDDFDMPMACAHFQEVCVLPGYPVVFQYVDHATRWVKQLVFALLSEETFDAFAAMPQSNNESLKVFLQFFLSTEEASLSTLKKVFVEKKQTEMIAGLIDEAIFNGRLSQLVTEIKYYLIAMLQLINTLPYENLNEQLSAFVRLSQILSKVACLPLQKGIGQELQNALMDVYHDADHLLKVHQLTETLSFLTKEMDPSQAAFEAAFNVLMNVWLNPELEKAYQLCVDALSIREALSIVEAYADAYKKRIDGIKFVTNFSASLHKKKPEEVFAEYFATPTDLGSEWLALYAQTLSNEPSYCEIDRQRIQSLSPPSFSLLEQLSSRECEIAKYAAQQLEKLRTDSVLQTKKFSALKTDYESVDVDKTQLHSQGQSLIAAIEAMEDRLVILQAYYRLGSEQSNLVVLEELVCLALTLVELKTQANEYLRWYPSLLELKKQFNQKPSIDTVLESLKRNFYAANWSVSLYEAEYNRTENRLQTVMFALPAAFSAIQHPLIEKIQAYNTAAGRESISPWSIQNYLRSKQNRLKEAFLFVCTSAKKGYGSWYAKRAEYATWAAQYQLSDSVRRGYGFRHSGATESCVDQLTQDFSATDESQSPSADISVQTEVSQVAFWSTLFNLFSKSGSSRHSFVTFFGIVVLRSHESDVTPLKVRLNLQEGFFNEEAGRITAKSRMLEVIQELQKEASH